MKSAFIIIACIALSINCILDIIRQIKNIKDSNKKHECKCNHKCKTKLEENK